MPKRGENIRKRKDGRWEARYIADRDSSGKALYRSIYGRSYAETKEKLKSEQLEKKHENPITDYMLFKELLNQWLQNNKIRYKQSTYSKYRYMIDRHIIPIMGDMKVTDVNVPMINTFLGDKMKDGSLHDGKKLSPAYVRTMALIINAALNYAVIEELRSPVKSEIFKPSVKQCKITTLSHAEYNHLSEYCQEHLNYTSIGILIALNTGLRVGEICALRWKDIDTDSHLLHVNNTVSRIKNDEDKCRWIMDTPKTASSLRDIPISETLMGALRQIFGLSNSDYIVSENEKFVNPKTFEYRYHKEICASRVTNVNFHALRHTFATRCVEGGMDIKTLSEILGHSNVSITLNTYVHSSLELKRSQIEKVEEFFYKGQKVGQ